MRDIGLELLSGRFTIKKNITNGHNNGEWKWRQRVKDIGALHDMADHNMAQARCGILMDADRWSPPEPEQHSSADLAAILKKADELWPFSSAKNMGLNGKGSA